MKYKFSIIFFFLLLGLSSQDLTDNQVLDEVIISSSKINLPFSKNFRTIKIIDSKEIQQIPANNVSDLLQQVTGIDVRRRGAGGVQGDLYIRGGGFDQTLLLVDGMKMDDVQTGHHTLNMILPLYLIERIEIIKGPAARIFGQNAFNGAINIVTKDFVAQKGAIEMNLNELSYGSFEQKNISLSTKITGENIKSLISYSGNRSDGYRHNTDYKRNNYFIKTSFNTNNAPVDILVSFNENKFGANGFYASPSATEQYEETQASLFGITTTINSENLSITPKLYWRRGQDEYIYIRDNPSVYRNLHKTNKVSAELSGSYFSDLGVTGFGIDLSAVNISSNNLGEHKRSTVNLFADHTFKLMDNKLMTTANAGLADTLEHLKNVAVSTNAEWADRLGIPHSTAITCVKPSGTVSQLVDSSSGIHARHSPYYIRTVRGDNKDPLTEFMKTQGIPNEPDVMKPDATTVFSFPMQSPMGAVHTADMTALEQLEMWLMYQRHWCEHKPSVTINVKADEWFEVGAFVYKHFDEMSGVSFLPFNEHTYQQAPYQECLATDYHILLDQMPDNIDWDKLADYEKEDNTSGMQTMACTGDVCEMVDIG